MARQSPAVGLVESGADLYRRQTRPSGAAWSLRHPLRTQPTSSVEPEESFACAEREECEILIVVLRRTAEQSALRIDRRSRARQLLARETPFPERIEIRQQCCRESHWTFGIVGD